MAILIKHKKALKTFLFVGLVSDRYSKHTYVVAAGDNGQLFKFNANDAIVIEVDGKPISDWAQHPDWYKKPGSTGTFHCMSCFAHSTSRWLCSHCGKLLVDIFF